MPIRAYARRVLLPTLGLVAVAWLVLIALDRLFPPPLAALERPPARVVTDAAGRPLRMFLAADETWRLPVGLDGMPEDLLAAVVASEDQRFYAHAGVDPLAVARALVSNLRAGRVVSGASTIPMQLARIAEPAPRTLGAKGREALRALQLERRLSKDELIERYLELAPYGGNLEGVGAASYFYFGKQPEQLSLGEIALLVALPRSPTAYDPVRRPEAAQRARDRVLDQLAERGVFAAGRLAEARRQGVPASRQPVPFAAPHFARWAAARSPGARVATTLDLRLQRRAEGALAARRPELAARGITNAAVAVVETAPRALRAHVGSADFADRTHGGQVDGALARRSPGSTLKPFLYALAYDRGAIVPDSWLLDIPTDYAGYVAQNYDGLFRGRVTASEALIASLNAPAVRLLADTGLADFHALLRRGGLGLDHPPGHYGLPLVLGAGEVSLVELTNLYASLAEGGRHRPLALLAGGAGGERPRPAGTDGGGEGSELFSRRAAELVAATLTEVARPDLPESWDLARGVPAVAWKTGTSFGHRDAWAVGFSGRWTVGVWVGNFDGRPVEGISGSRDAGPLLFDLFRALGDDGPPALARAAGVPGETLAVCADSHRLPGPWCPRRVEVAYLPGRTRLGACTEHRRVFVDRVSGELLAGPCLAERPYRAQVLRVEPPELAAWRRAAGEDVPPLPALAAACGGVPAAEPPRIVSPDGATPYRLRRDAPAAYQRIPLIARAGPYSRALYWFQDGALVASAAAGEKRFVLPRPGEHRLVLVDDTGRSDRIIYRVE